MAIVVMILGESGTGKSASLRHFSDDELAVVNVVGKPLPFRKKHFETISSDSYGEISKFLKKTDKKSIVIDDAQYLMANEYMRRAQEKGFDKFTEIGQNFWNLVNSCIQKLPADTIVYFLQHVESTADGSGVKAKTIGKLIDEKITLEGMFSIVLRTCVTDEGYFFRTQNNGSDTVKSPVGMFDDELISNDLKTVDQKIREYYELETAAVMESGGFADAIQEHKEYLDVNAPHVDVVDDETPLQGKTLLDDLKEIMKSKGITQAELKDIVAEKGVYPKSAKISEYEDDFIEYLIHNINKIEAAIIRKRG